jgi:hypothetical protein
VSPDPNTTSSGSAASGNAAGRPPGSAEIGELPKAPAFVALNSVARAVAVAPGYALLVAWAIAEELSGG